MTIKRLLCALLCLMLLSSLLPPAPASAEADWQSLPYWIGVDIGNQRTTIYRTSDNSVVHRWICSSGAHNLTPVGVFYLPAAKGSERKEWFSFTSSYVKYCVRYTKHLYFHTILFREPREGTEIHSSIRQLGKPASHGCIRLQVPAARWLCYNCPTGTKVVIHRGADDPLIVEALGASAGTELTDTAILPQAVQSVAFADVSMTDLALGQQLQLTPVITPSDTYTSYKWKTSNKKAFKVSDSGLVTAVGVGKSKITVTTGNGKTASVTLRAYDPTLPEIVALDRTGTITLNKGETLALNAAMSPATAVSGLTWSSSKKSVARVGKDGTITAVAAGTATIKVRTRNKKTASVTVKVVDPTIPDSIALAPGGTVTLKKGETLSLSAVITPQTAKSAPLTWKSSKKRVARVSAQGVVTAVSTGKANITVKTRNGKKAVVTIIVVNP